MPLRDASRWPADDTPAEVNSRPAGRRPPILDTRPVAWAIRWRSHLAAGLVAWLAYGVLRLVGFAAGWWSHTSTGLVVWSVVSVVASTAGLVVLAVGGRSGGRR